LTDQSPAASPQPVKCACWLGTDATFGKADERRACPVHGDAARQTPPATCHLEISDANNRWNKLALAESQRQRDVAPATSPGVDMREQLAALAHEQWAGWMRYLFSKGVRPVTGGVYLPSEWSDRWARQMNTPYAELSEAEKESDHTEADRVLAVVAAERQQHTAREADLQKGQATLMRALESSEAEVASLTQQLTEARQENERLKAEIDGSVGGDVLDELHQIFTLHRISSRLDFPELATHVVAWAAKHQRSHRKRALEAEQARAALQQQIEALRQAVKQFLATLQADIEMDWTDDINRSAAALEAHLTGGDTT
jgi:hypothetical protein